MTSFSYSVYSVKPPLVKEVSGFSAISPDENDTQSHHLLVLDKKPLRLTSEENIKKIGSGL